MTQSNWVIAAKVAQLLAGASWLGVVVLLLWLIRAPETRQVADPRAAVWGLKVAVGVVAPSALLGLAAAYGIMRNQRWGWWLAVVADLSALLVSVYSLIDDGWRNMDPTLVGLTMASAAPIVLLLLPGVRRFYWGRPPRTWSPRAVS